MREHQLTITHEQLRAALLAWEEAARANGGLKAARLYWDCETAENVADAATSRLWALLAK